MSLGFIKKKLRPSGNRQSSDQHALILAVHECFEKRKVVFQAKRALVAGLHLTKAVGRL